MSAVVQAIAAVAMRDVRKLFRQRGRLLASMIRPLLWLVVIGGGFAASEPAARGAGYQSFLVPGVLGMTVLFGAALAALATVYDKESGVMRMLIIAPLEPAWIVAAKAAGAAVVALIQAVLLLIVLAPFGYFGAVSWPWLAVGLAATALACGCLGMLVAAWTTNLDNYAGMMNFFIFPVFFLSGSLYPVERLPAALKFAAAANPYTHGVDLLRHATHTGPAFSRSTDLAVIMLFSVAAIAVAGARFSAAGVFESRVRRLAQ
jgi:ABC-2 type transport system permease protein